jgi:hypothetical protein
MIVGGGLYLLGEGCIIVVAMGGDGIGDFALVTLAVLAVAFATAAHSGTIAGFNRYYPWLLKPVWLERLVRRAQAR